MTNPYYNGGSFPATGSPATSASMRAELSSISAGFDKLPTLSGNANKLVVVNSSASALEVTTALPPITIADTSLIVEDNGDNTRRFRFEANVITPGATRVLTVPDANLTLVGEATTQTLTNKTLNLASNTLVATSAQIAAAVTDETGSGALVFGTNPTISGATLTGGSLNNTPIGGSTPNTGAFTTLSSTGNTTLGDAVGDLVTVNGTTTFVNANPTLSAGTANGVLYLNGSKVATSGAALAFNGTSLLVGKNSSDANNWGVQNYATNAFGSGMQLTYGGVGSAGVWVPAASSLAFGADAGSGTTELMRLTSTGLGIGTSSPTQKLEVAGSVLLNPTNPALAFNTLSYQVYKQGTSLRLYANSIDHLVCDGTGNVGIGTSSPNAKLEVNGNAILGAEVYRSVDTSYLRIAGGNPAATGANLIVFGSTHATAPGRVSINAVGTGHTEFSTGGAERMRIDSSGNLGLGVTPSAWNADYKVIQMGPTGSIYGRVGTNEIALFQNLYRDTAGNFKFLQNGYGASFAFLSGGGAAWYNWGNNVSGAGAAASPTQAMTLDADGRLALGATGINGTSNRASFVNSVTAKGVLALQSTSTSGYSAIELYDSGGTQQGAVGWGNASVAVTGAASATYLYSTGAITFLSGGTTERARITSGGYFKASNGGTYVGSTSPYHELRKTENNADWAVLISHAGATAANQFGTRVDLAGDPNGLSNEFLYCSGGATLRASIRSNGGLANFSGNNVNLSDRREKTNFAPAKSYLDTICAIPVQTFNYIDQSEDDPGLTLGVVAQDVQAVAPELVMESNWGTEDEPKMRLSIYQTDLQYALMKCIQEQQALITALTARVQALEGV